MESALGLPKDKLNQSWASLSGGERQRAGLALALLLLSTVDRKTTDELPSCVLLLDEPTAACDPVSTHLVEKALIESGVTIIMVTHDSAQANRIANKKIVIS